MSYHYADFKSALFTDKGQRELLKVRDHAFALIDHSGAATMERIMTASDGDTWTQMSYVDRLVELGDLIQVSSGKESTQYRCFRRKVRSA